MHQTTEAEVMQAMMRRVLMEMAEANRMMVHVPDRILSERYVKSVEALTYALEQVWVPKDVALAVLPLAEETARLVALRLVALRKYSTEPQTIEDAAERLAKWQALADALGGK